MFENDIIPIPHRKAIEFLLPRHYSGRKPNIMFAFGWYIDGKLMAVCTFGKPASPSLCVGVCGEEYKDRVIELNRLCREDSLDRPLSYFVSRVLKMIDGYIVVSFSDMAMKHHGYIYQACNFLYTGCTKERTDKYVGGDKHSRHYDNNNQNGKRVLRSPKHRYIYFCGDKKQKKLWKHCLKYKIESYPKGNNENYTLGKFLKKVVIKDGQQIQEQQEQLLL